MQTKEQLREERDKLIAEMVGVVSPDLAGNHRSHGIVRWQVEFGETAPAPLSSSDLAKVIAEVNETTGYTIEIEFDGIEYKWQIA
jgi:hypothetical protein